MTSAVSRLRRSSAIAASPAAQNVLRRCACGQHASAVECSECFAHGTDNRLHRRSTGETLAGDVPGSVYATLGAPGTRLDPAIRGVMEPWFGYDFSHVRVHTDSPAAKSAADVHALAYTAGAHIVFGSGQYSPHTSAGKRLLAHELAHVSSRRGDATLPASLSLGPDDEGEQHARQVEHEFIHVSSSQTGRRSDDAQLLRRQPAPTAPAGWGGCRPTAAGSLNADLGEATSWVADAIADLQRADRPGRTNAALSRYLSTDAGHITSTILPHLQQIQTELVMGAGNFRCQSQQQCDAAFSDGAVAFSGNPITLCPPYFDEGDLDRPTTLIHEAGHNAGLAGNVIEWQWPFAGLSISTRLRNTESYAAFVRSNRYPSLAPLQQLSGLQLGVGALSPGGGLASPRFVVTAELDTVVAQRLFRFFDLRLGVRFDIDSSGTLLGSAVVGTRMFAPATLSTTPLFLDLRGGVVVGRAADVGPSFERLSSASDINVLGASGDARVGILPGNWGLSVDYRHIWNLIRNNPNLHQVIINGEIRF